MLLKIEGRAEIRGIIRGTIDRGIIKICRMDNTTKTASMDQGKHKIHRGLSALISSKGENVHMVKIAKESINSSMNPCKR
jgi:hypothetical protein